LTIFAYMDASAMVKLVIEEAQSEALASFLDQVPSRVTSTAGRVELARVVRRHTHVHSSAPRIDFDSVMASIDVIPLRDEILRLAERIGPPTLRSLDAIHLAAVSHLQGAGAVLVSYDQRLMEAADLHGINFVSPQ
jgi:predicted nucleic acid-binding protein